MSKFQFPPVYSYPPFWTIQLNSETKKKQLDLWGNIVLAFMKSINKTEMDLLTSLDTPLFNNKKISRKLSKSDVDQIIEHLISSNNAKWLDDLKIRVRIIWRTHEQWGKIIKKYIEDIGQTNTVFTFEELLHGDEIKKLSFYNLSPELFLDAVKYLETINQAKVYQNPNILESGVKFF